MATQPTVVIVVDDNPTFLKSVTRLLTVHGFATKTFSSAEALLDSDGACDATCLLLDIHLGGMSGIELQRRLGALESQRNASRPQCVAFVHRGSAVPHIAFAAAAEPGVTAAKRRLGQGVIRQAAPASPQVIEIETPAELAA